MISNFYLIYLFFKKKKKNKYNYVNKKKNVHLLKSVKFNKIFCTVWIRSYTKPSSDLYCRSRLFKLYLLWILIL